MSNIHGLFKIRQYTSHTSKAFPLIAEKKSFL